jgi:hypothetical protein
VLCNLRINICKEAHTVTHIDFAFSQSVILVSKHRQDDICQGEGKKTKKIKEKREILPESIGIEHR